MRILVDCTPLHSGGGVQVAVAFLDNLHRHSQFTWQAIIPKQVAAALPANLLSMPEFVFVRKEIPTDILKIRSRLIQMEREFAPHVVFTVFGPAYFRPKAPHLVGFAIPHMIYDPFPGMPVSKRLRHMLLDSLRCKWLRKADHLVVETNTVRKRLAQRLGIGAERISVIGNSLNPILARHSISPLHQKGRFVFLIPSAYYPHKNLEIIPGVAQALQNIDPGFDFEFRFTLDPASTAWQKIWQAACRLGVEIRVRTLGPLTLDELAKAYNMASAVFLPTLREASTAVYPESFYFQRPLITSDLDFARELCGEAALYVPPMGVAIIAQRMYDLAKSPALAETLVKAGAARLANIYPDPERKFEMQIELLERVARNDHPGREMSDSGKTGEVKGT